MLYLYISNIMTHTHTHLTDYPGKPVPEQQQQQQRPFNGLWSGTTRVGRYQKALSPLTPIRINVLPLSSFSICNDPWHPLYSAYVLYSPHVQPLSRSSLVFPLVLNPQLHAPYISSPSPRHLFATHYRTSAAYSAAIPMQCHLHLVSLSAPYLPDTINRIKMKKNQHASTVVPSLLGQQVFLYIFPDQQCNTPVHCALSITAII